MVSFDEDAPSAYSQQVGERLRVIRKQKRLSLQEVEAQSTQEFKASVLGAYERGERALSVPRLDRLAQFYSCPDRATAARVRSPARRRQRIESPTNKKSGDRCLQARAAQRFAVRDARPVSPPDPGAAAGLQRPGHHRARRRHPWRSQRCSTCPSTRSPIASRRSTCCSSRSEPTVGRSDACSGSISTFRSAPRSATTARSRPGPTALTSSTSTSTHSDSRSVARSMAGLPIADTIFVGGGTPTLVPPHGLAALIIDSIPRATDGAEVTVECNPDDVTVEMLEDVSSPAASTA